MMTRWSCALLLVACGAQHAEELPPGVSTAKRTAPRPPVEEPDAGTAVASRVEPEPVAPPRYELRIRTGMSMSGKQNDPHKVIARIEQAPGMLQTCAPYAAREPNAPEGTWNVELTLKGKKSELEMHSPVSESFELCMQDAAATWDLTGVGTGKLMLLLGLDVLTGDATSEQ